MDLTLLAPLAALLDSGSVTAAAQRLHLSPSAVSRILTRLREQLGDPLLVRAGRRLELTPRARDLRPEVEELLRQAEALLVPTAFDPAKLTRSFTIRASDASYTVFGRQIAERLVAEAPGVQFRFVVEGKDDLDELRHGTIDLDLGATCRERPPEIRRQALFSGRMVGLVRRGHALLSERMSAARFARESHISVSRRGLARGPIDELLAAQGLERRVSLVVPTHLSSLFLVADSELVGTALPELAEYGIRLGLTLATFALPVRTPPLDFELTWHARWHADPGHSWLRNVVAEVCRPRL